MVSHPTRNIPSSTPKREPQILEYHLNMSLILSSSYTILPTFGKTRGMKPRVLNWTYTMLIRPTLNHGSMVWWLRKWQEVSSMEVIKLHRSACLATTAAMEVLLRLAPLHVTVEAEGQAGIYRLLCDLQLSTWGLLSSPNVYDFSLFLKPPHKTFQQESLVINIPYQTLCLQPMVWSPKPHPKTLSL
jgi:hypothetical protein